MEHHSSLHKRRKPCGSRRHHPIPGGDGQDHCLQVIQIKELFSIIRRYLLLDSEDVGLDFLHLLPLLSTSYLELARRFRPVRCLDVCVHPVWNIWLLDHPLGGLQCEGCGDHIACSKCVEVAGERIYEEKITSYYSKIRDRGKKHTKVHTLYYELITDPGFNYGEQPEDYSSFLTIVEDGVIQAKSTMLTALEPHDLIYRYGEKTQCMNTKCFDCSLSVTTNGGDLV